MKQIAIVFSNSNDSILTLSQEITSFLKNRDIEVSIIDSRAQGIDLRDIDLAISLGGDGTVLSVARMAAPFGVPIFPVNMGTLGFLAEASVENWQVELEKILLGELHPYPRLMLQTQLWRGGQCIFQSPTMNEAVVSGGGISKLIGLDINLRAGSLGSYRADGVLIASPSGSTAYNLAAGGPIIHPDTEALIVTPICPFSLALRPLVLPGWETVELSILSKQRTSVILSVDGQIDQELLEGDEVHIQAAPYRAQFIGSHRRAFYEIIRKKLHWSGAGSA